jgi:hypothetical protein
VAVPVARPVVNAAKGAANARTNNLIRRYMNAINHPNGTLKKANEASNAGKLLMKNGVTWNVVKGNGPSGADNKIVFKDAQRAIISSRNRGASVLKHYTSSATFKNTENSLARFRNERIRLIDEYLNATVNGKNDRRNNAVRLGKKLINKLAVHWGFDKDKSTVVFVDKKNHRLIVKRRLPKNALTKYGSSNRFTNNKTYNVVATPIATPVQYRPYVAANARPPPKANRVPNSRQSPSKVSGSPNSIPQRRTSPFRNPLKALYDVNWTGTIFSRHGHGGTHRRMFSDTY